MRFTRIRAIVAAGLVVTATTVGAVTSAGGSAMAGTGVPERAVPVPGGQLFGVAATSARNAWAVGADEKGGILQHWNGKAWK